MRLVIRRTGPLKNKGVAAGVFPQGFQQRGQFFFRFDVMDFLHDPRKRSVLMIRTRETHLAFKKRGGPMVIEMINRRDAARRDRDDPKDLLIFIAPGIVGELKDPLQSFGLNKKTERFIVSKDL